MIHEKIKEALKMFESADVNEVTIDVDDVIINITRKGYISQIENNGTEWIITSPFVGVVYLKNADGVSYVEKNQAIHEKEAVCYIETLKVHHEILCEYTGIIDEIYVKDKEFVEYNQPLIKIKRL